MIQILNRDHLNSLLIQVVVDDYLSEACQAYLFRAFEWRTTIEGHDHWRSVWYGLRPFTQADFDSLVNQIGAKESPPRPPEEDLWI